MWSSLYLFDMVESFIPPWGELIILEKPYRRAAIEVLDVDGIPEICAQYKWNKTKYFIVSNNKLEVSKAFAEKRLSFPMIC